MSAAERVRDFRESVLETMDASALFGKECDENAIRLDAFAAAVRAEALEEVREVIKNEWLIDAELTKHPSDKAYNQALNDALGAVAKLEATP